MDWADNMGQRVRGYVYPPVTGQYRFWIAGDDESRLILGTSRDPADRCGHRQRSDVEFISPVGQVS